MKYDEDFTSGAKKKLITVLNPHNYPVVANEDGQALGGRKTARVFSGDSVAVGAIRIGLLLVVSDK